MPSYAHSLPGTVKSAWQPLEEHLEAVGELAGTFAAPFAATDLAQLAGLWHDLGKYAPDWQRFLDEAGSEAPTMGEETPDPKRRRGPDHSTAGAIHALRTFGEKSWQGLILRFVIAAHHAGLANHEDLRDRLENPEKTARYEASLREAARDILSPAFLPPLPGFLAESGPARTPAEKEAARTRFEALVRMVFSALVDADFLDTERFMDSAKPAHEMRAEARPSFGSIADYRATLDSSLTRFDASPPTRVNEQRRRVLDWSRAAAAGPRGAYSLTVPTGGGKTLSALAFALHHAEIHGLDRVIVALPFLSILDQTADVYRSALEPGLGSPVLIEHHSNVTPAHDTVANRLAAENWDAPLIVTTQVQLFESLFSRRPSHCRKLHRLANSVIVLDEVQTLPADLLTPILDQLQQLRAHYGCTLLLTTATQPSLHSRAFPHKRFLGLDPPPFEIVPPDALPALFDSLRRIDVVWPADDLPIEWPDLAAQLNRHEQVLAIVHKRSDAVKLWRECDLSRPGSWIHLSALMCPAHRRETLADIRARLAADRPCRVVSTQLVEAGVDVDFPVVYRAMAGLESLAQSAGRCNREGRLPGRGRFHVYHPRTAPPGVMRQHRDIAAMMLKADPALDLLHPETFRKYFDILYGMRTLDVRGIQALRSGLRFEEVDRTFRMIDSAAETIFVPFGNAGRRAIDALRHAGPSKSRFRALQPYGVSVYPDALRKLRSEGAVQLLENSEVYALVSDAHYDRSLGLLVDPEPFGAAIV